jgi:hypothetical protein
LWIFLKRKSRVTRSMGGGPRPGYSVYRGLVAVRIGAHRGTAACSPSWSFGQSEAWRAEHGDLIASEEATTVKAHQLELQATKDQEIVGGHKMHIFIVNIPIFHSRYRRYVLIINEFHEFC